MSFIADILDLFLAPSTSFLIGKNSVIYAICSGDTWSNICNVKANVTTAISLFIYFFHLGTSSESASGESSPTFGTPFARQDAGTPSDDGQATSQEDADTSSTDAPV